MSYNASSHLKLKMTLISTDSSPCLRMHAYAAAAEA